MFKQNFNFFSSFIKNHFAFYPSPFNLSYFWNFGFISAFFLFIQIISGIFLAMHYCSESSLAFFSIENIARNINFGWFLRYLHSNGASFFFIAVYLHIARGIFYRSFCFYNLTIWITGLFIFLLMMGTAFIGYVLPWGQMSFWGATVIINLVSAIPYIGIDLVYWLWGGFSVSGPTLSRFFSLHYFLPFILIFLLLLHLFFLHERGSSNPSFVSFIISKTNLPLYPYFFLKDFIGLFFTLFLFLYILAFLPDFLGHSDNYIEANPLSTPFHIVPEWYFLPFYAILRSVPDKLLGVCLMFFAIIVFFTLPFIDYFFRLNSAKHTFIFYNYVLYPSFCFLFFTVFIFLGWLGSQPAEYPFTLFSGIFTLLYFIVILLISF